MPLTKLRIASLVSIVASLLLMILSIWMPEPILKGPFIDILTKSSPPKTVLLFTMAVTAMAGIVTGAIFFWQNLKNGEFEIKDYLIDLGLLFVSILVFWIVAKYFAWALIFIIFFMIICMFPK